MRNGRRTSIKDDTNNSEVVKIVQFKVLKIKDPRLSRIKEVNTLDFAKN